MTLNLFQNRKLLAERSVAIRTGVACLFITDNMSSDGSGRYDNKSTDGVSSTASVSAFMRVFSFKVAHF